MIRSRLLVLADLAGRSLTRLPGLLALTCAIAGAYVLAGLGVALIVAAVMLLAIDLRMP